MPGLPLPAAASGPLPDLLDALLDETPQVRDRARQQALTDRFLVPALPALEALFLALRAGLDPALRRAHPDRPDKPYPKGLCLEITRAAQARLETLRPDDLAEPAATGLRALRAFQAAGGQVRRAWGDLRGQFFQNALIVGALYVDVANDTVVLTKPPVEILPFAAADFRPIRDYAHFADIAGRYWGVRCVPNHLAPRLAPHLPLILLGPGGEVSVGPVLRHMLGLALAGRFAPSARALAAPPMPPALFAALRMGLGP
ncbi:hypothetical protein, partial [Phenylobacterium sp.]|uniref:hypothetical protein n=1 Tax=Phenylobacterium sp. TaxID=1871053 RepID=UPI0025E97E4B